MITSAIGKLLIESYNEKHGTSFDSESFFMDIYYPLFYDQEKYLMSPGNNPLENPKISWENMLKGRQPFENKEQRKKRLEKLLEKIESGRPNTENAIGFASEDILSTTAGQTSNINYPLTRQDIFSSWIGASLGIGVEGGLSILFMKKDILLDLFEGWTHYRTMLNGTKKMKGNQVNTWNAQWIVHKYNKHEYIEHAPMANLNILIACKGKYNGCQEIKMTAWTKVLISIARQYKDPQMMGYIYNFGQTNTTYGFIPFYMSHIRRAVELYNQFFGISEGLKAESIWGDPKGFRAACLKGAIGIKALEPIALKNSWKNDIKLKYNSNNETTIISYNTYKIWLMAILNNQELWDKSNEFAVILHNYLTNNPKSISTERKNRVDSLLNSRTKKMFIDSATTLMDDSSIVGPLSELVKLVHMMPNDNVPYFITLIKFNKIVLDNQ